MKRTRISAEQALQEVVLQNGVTVEEVRKEIKLAMLVGLCNTAPSVRARWKEMPCAGEVPAPEELITYIAEIATSDKKQSTRIVD